MKRDYIKDYNEYWKNIVENEDGTLNKDQVMRELSDYSMVIDNCSRAYYTMTNGIISKPNTMFFEVENKFEENYLLLDETTIWGEIDDLVDILNDAETLDELKEEIKKYFGIREQNDNNGR